MGKSKKEYEGQDVVEWLIPKAPFIYLHDPTDTGAIASKLAKLVPKSKHIFLNETDKHSEEYCSRIFKKFEKNVLSSSEHYDTVFIFSHKESDNIDYAKEYAADLIRESTIKLGCNFASVNICSDNNIPIKQWGANHLNIQWNGTVESLSEWAIEFHAEKIYKWLFSKFSVLDTLHLISDKEMTTIDETVYPDYEYCPIGKVYNAPLDKKIQFKVLILTKPAVGSDKKLCWQVADKTGIADFYFEWCGPSSQKTWDWVLAFEPGQRKCLPRMSSILIKESLLVTIAKAPIRIPASIIKDAGTAFKVLGSGLRKTGNAMKMGSRRKWVAQPEAAEYLKQHRGSHIVRRDEEKSIKVFTPKEYKTWDDDDSTGSTLEGDLMDEKKEIE